MKKVLFIILLTISASAFAQQAESITDQYAAHLGGYAGFKKIKTVKITGKTIVGEQSFPMLLVVQTGKSIYNLVDIGDQKFITGYDQGKGWVTDFRLGPDTIRDMDEPELLEQKGMVSMGGPLIEYRENGTRLGYGGVKKVREKDVYRIDLYDSTGNMFIKFYIDTTTYMPVQMSLIKTKDGKATETQIVPSMPQWVGGVLFFMKQEAYVNGQLSQTLLFDKVEVNIPVDRNIFQKPVKHH